MKKCKREFTNYLDYIPKHNEKFEWKTDEQDGIIIFVKHKGVFHFLTQKLLGKPKVSQVHLDKMGSYIWSIIDGKHTIADIGEFAEKEFGEEIRPLYPRLVQYIRTLEYQGFIEVRAGTLLSK